MAIIQLPHGKEAIIDDADLPLVSRFRWHMSRGGYVLTNPPRGGNKVALHNLLMQPENGMQVDHINRDKLDCRRCNLRLATSLQNSRNRRARAGHSSQYKGVIRSKGRFIAGIRVDGVQYRLGNYRDEVEAAKAYDKAARFYFREFACTNFPGTEALPAEVIWPKRQCSSRFRGVSRNGTRKWHATIFAEGRPRDLGWWNREEDAASAYDAAARYYFGPDARVNFPQGECLPAEVIRARSDTHFMTGRCCYRQPNGRWVAQIDINRKTTYLGTFATEAEAQQAVLLARQKHGQGLPDDPRPAAA